MPAMNTRPSCHVANEKSDVEGIKKKALWIHIMQYTIIINFDNCNALATELYTVCVSVVVGRRNRKIIFNL